VAEGASATAAGFFIGVCFVLEDESQGVAEGVSATAAGFFIGVCFVLGEES